MSREGFADVQLKIALLIFGVNAAGASLTYYAATLPR
jgi:hypothetical protein